MIPLATLLAFISVMLLSIRLVSHHPDPVDSRLQTIKSSVRPRRSPMEQPFAQRAVTPVMASFGNALLALFPTTWVQAASRKLVWAGSPITTSGFVIVWLSMVFVFTAMPLFMVSSSNGSGLVLVGAGLVGLAIGGYGPLFWLNSRIASRNFQARKQLPDALDLMTTSVEAGLSLDAALMRVAEFQEGPLQEEVARALQEMTLGKARRDALAEICDRLNVQELSSFIQTLNQAEVTGAPIGQVLRVQAEQVRVKRRQAAEAQAQRAPLLMIIPLVLFIFPSLFVVLLGPAAMTVIRLLKDSTLLGA